MQRHSEGVLKNSGPRDQSHSCGWFMYVRHRLAREISHATLDVQVLHHIFHP